MSKYCNKTGKLVYGIWDTSSFIHTLFSLEIFQECLQTVLDWPLDYFSCDLISNVRRSLFSIYILEILLHPFRHILFLNTIGRVRGTCNTSADALSLSIYIVFHLGCRFSSTCIKYFTALIYEEKDFKSIVTSKWIFKNP